MNETIKQFYIDESDKALCQLNEEVLRIKNSKEYRMGVKILKLSYAIKHLDFMALKIALAHRNMHKKLKPYFKKNNIFLSFNPQIITKKRIAIYTCITGNYDKPIEPLYVPGNIDFYIITDMELPENSAWKKIEINSIIQISNFDNTKKARYVKTHPHVFFTEYEYSVWVDSNFRVIGNLEKFIKCIGKVIPFASNWHPDRNSIYTELDACIIRGKDDASILRRQVENYRAIGMPDNFGLIETNMIVRRHMDIKCIELMEAWWNEIVKWSKRDQISLPFVLWRLGYTMNDIGFIGMEVRNNSSVQVLLHSIDYTCPKK